MNGDLSRRIITGRAPPVNTRTTHKDDGGVSAGPRRRREKTLILAGWRTIVSARQETRTKRGREAKMPIYEYQCNGCNHRTEILQRLNEKKRPRCGECGGSMKRVISPSAFILKGSGWYVTDYPSESRKKGMESEKKRGEKKKKDADSTKKPTSTGKTPSPASGAKKSKSKAATSR